MTDIGLLILRLSAGLTMFLAHGLPKMMKFNAMKTQFPDPIGLGSELSLGLAIFAEVFCSVALVLGLVTRIAAVPLFLTMTVAFMIVHASDPWSTKELPFIYAMLYMTLFFTGGGNYGLDNFVRKRN